MTAVRTDQERRGVVLITGAAGRIGHLLRRALPLDPALAQRYGGRVRLRVTDLVNPGPDSGADEVATGNLADAGFVNSLFADGRVEAVIHLAGHPREADWDVLLDANIRASIHIWEAARKAGTDRILYASSNHAIGLYPRSQTIDDRVLPRPDSRYGLTKVFGEELGFLYAWKFGVRAFSMRIGSFLPEPDSHRALSTWISPDDMVALVRVGLVAEYACAIVYGVSDNSRSFWDNSAATRLGYHPRHSADRFADRFPSPANPADELAQQYQGGPYVPHGLVGRPERLAGLDDPTT